MSHVGHSTLLWVLSDIFSATDKGEVLLLALLDVSATFDTVDHSILLNRLSISYGISGSAFDWMQSFIVGRTKFITVVQSQGVLSCDLELPRDQYWARSCTSCTQQMSRNLWNKSVLESISMPTTPSFTIHASRQMLQY